jgi:hypothetical protein
MNSLAANDPKRPGMKRVAVTSRTVARFCRRCRGIGSQRFVLALALATASILDVAHAHAGPCTADIKQFEQAVRRSAKNPDAGPMAPQTIGAQLGHQPTPASVRQAEKRAQAAFASALVSAKRFDTRGHRAACTHALTRAKRLYSL